MHWRQHIARHGTALLPGEPWMRRTFLVLWALAAVLRFWDLPHLAYTHDELSALVRIYPTLSETITTGVARLDTHPPGVQAFEWLWTRLFSVNEADVKLPFIAMGLAAILLLYRVALAWTGAGAALALTALLATLQYTVLYSQLARPYAAGLFTTALLADQLTRYIAFGKRRMLVGAGVAMVASAYTHHFALMLAALMALTGLLLVPAAQRRAWLIGCGIAVVLYLPNLPIFMTQLGLGGLSEWLAAPGPDWVPKHLWWVAHGSLALAVLLSAVVLLSLVLRVWKRAPVTPATWFLLVWGLVPLVVGLGYSLWRAPVIQHSVLLFSFPYLVLALFGGLRHLGRNASIVLAASLAFVSTRSLVQERQHYAVMYTSRYEAFMTDGLRLSEQLGKDRVAVMIDAPDHMLRFYADHLGIPRERLPYVQLQDAVPDDRLDSLLRVWPGDHLFLGASNGALPERAARVQRHFPHLLQRRDMNEGQWFLFSRTPGFITWDDRKLVAQASPASRWPSTWDIHGDLPVNDSLAGAPAWDLSGREFGIALELLLDTLVDHPQQQVEVVADVWSSAPLTNAGWIAHQLVGDSTVFYRGGDVRGLLPGGRSASLIVATHRGDAMGLKGPVQLKTYLHNREQGALFITRVSVYLREENPVQFGMVEPFRWLGRYPVK